VICSHKIEGYFVNQHFDTFNSCEIMFTQSAAKEALSNPHVVEVLNKYFRIK